MDTVKEGIRRTLADLMAMSGKRNIDLADACHVGKSAVSNWLSGKNSIDIELIPVICDFFGVTVDEFFGRSKSMQPTVLSSDERELLSTYRGASPTARAAILASVHAIAASIGEGVGHYEYEFGVTA